MANVKYKYNPDTLSYDKLETGFKYYSSKIAYLFLLGGVIGFAYFVAYVYLLDSPRERQLSRENSQLLTNYEIMSKKLDMVEKVLSDVQQRDENIYRVIFQTDSIPNSIRLAGFGGVNRYESLEDLDNSKIAIQTAKKLDIIMKQLYVQSKSFDEIIDLAVRKDELLRVTPSIMPIANNDLKRTASGWGWRIDPVYKIRKFHEGMDFTAPIGTDVYASADGVIASIRKEYTGYGNNIRINHGFGYTTLYAHLSGFNVKEGDAVKRGDIIGFVGNTGKSTGPHLHYEVHVRNSPVDPRNYYYSDLTAEQYEEMISISSNSNQTFD
ncbi:MAG: M23 family metallopeptidase [Breznakibacter sp.]|nr:M23 family metallopeptidase [Breznakibacter sp.]